MKRLNRTFVLGALLALGGVAGNIGTAYTELKK